MSSFWPVMYTVWVDFRNRFTGVVGLDYPSGALPRGVAPAFATTQGVTSGMGLDANAFVTDGNGGMDWHNYTLTVIDLNDPPVITTVDVTSAAEGVLYSVDYDANDPNGDDLTWTLSTDCGFLSIDPDTGAIVPQERPQR